MKEKEEIVNIPIEFKKDFENGNEKDWEEFGAVLQKDYERSLSLKEVKIQMSEIFATVQGEGPSTGIPVVFIRLGQCNLSCSWCDTAYTWAYNDRLARGHNDRKMYDPNIELTWMTEDEILAKVAEVCGGATTIILTGGEPLYWNKVLAPLLIKLTNKGFRIEIETNGTIMPERLVHNNISQYNVSPKLENSGNTVKEREKAKMYKWFVDNYKRYKGIGSRITDEALPEPKLCIFKFVICDVEDLKEVNLLMGRYNIPPSMIWLMPEGITTKEMANKAEWLIDICKETGFNFCQRLQVVVYGDMRGV